MEACLILLGIFQIGKKFEFQNVEVKNNWILFKTTAIRPETYCELIVRKTKEYLEKTNG